MDEHTRVHERDIVWLLVDADAQLRKHQMASGVGALAATGYISSKEKEKQRE